MRSLTKVREQMLTPYNLSLETQATRLFPDLGGREHVAIAREVEELIRWEPVVVRIPPSAGAKPCGVCQREVGATEDRFKVTKPPWRDRFYDPRGNILGIYVGRECIEAAKDQVMLNWPDPVEVIEFLRELEEETLPRLGQLGGVIEVGEQTKLFSSVAGRVREWMGGGSR